MLTPLDCCMWVALLHQALQLVCFDRSQSKSGTAELGFRRVTMAESTSKMAPLPGDPKFAQGQDPKFPGRGRIPLQLSPRSYLSTVIIASQDIRLPEALLTHVSDTSSVLVAEMV